VDKEDLWLIEIDCAATREVATSCIAISLRKACGIRRAGKNERLIAMRCVHVVIMIIIISIHFIKM